MSMKDDILRFHNQIVPDSLPFLDLFFLHRKLVERIKKEAENG